MEPNLLSLDGLVSRLGVLGVAAGYSGDGRHDNLSALNLALQQARLLGDGGRLNLLDWVAHLGDLVDAVVVRDNSGDGSNEDLGVGLSLSLTVLCTGVVDTGRGGQGGDGRVGALVSGHVLANVLVG